MSETQKHTKPNVPNLRFPGFRGEWGLHLLSEFCQKITRKNKGNVISNVLCNSANQGIIPQSEYFDRAIANSDNTAGYYIIEQDDFVYNPRKSTTAPYGPVNIYHGSEPGIISPLYLCFKTTGINREFLYYFFKSKSWWPYMYENGDSGVRHDRVSIKDDVFFSMPIHMPSIKEQDKIANILSLIDQRISIQNKIIEDLLRIKQSVNHCLLTRKDDSYRIVSLGDITEIITRRNKERIDYPMYSVTNDRGFIPQTEQFEDREMSGEDISAYKIILENEIAYNPARINVGSIAQYTKPYPCMISSLYVCIRAKEGVDSKWLIQVLKSDQLIGYYNLYAEGGVRLYLFYPNFSKIKVALPPYAEQQRISNTLETIEKKIQLETKVLSGYRRTKQALLDVLLL